MRRIGAGGVLALVGAAVSGAFVGTVAAFAFDRLMEDPATATVAATTSPARIVDTTTSSTPAVDTSAAPATAAPTTTTTSTTTPPRLTPDEILAATAPSVVSLESAGCGFGVIGTGFVLADGIVVGGPALAAGAAESMAYDANGTRLGPFAVDAAFDGGTAVSIGALQAAPLAANAGPPVPGDDVVIVGRLRYDRAAADVVSATVQSAGAATVSARTASAVDRSAIGSPVLAADGTLTGVVIDVTGSTATVGPVPTVPRAGAAPLIECREAPGALHPRDHALFQEPEHRSFLVAQYLARSLADGDWAVVRSIEPERRNFSDNQFEDGWGTLEVSTLVPVATSPLGGSAYRWRVGLVAHERIAGAAVTKLFCVTWDIDLAAGIVDQTGLDGRHGDTSRRGYEPSLADRSGWVDPGSLTTLFRDVC